MEKLLSKLNFLKDVKRIFNYTVIGFFAISLTSIIESDVKRRDEQIVRDQIIPTGVVALVSNAVFSAMIDKTIDNIEIESRKMDTIRIDKNLSVIGKDMFIMKHDPRFSLDVISTDTLP